MKYRHDIDGLRAIAVLSVILFHSGVHFISGGFVGVDIFFVISGYLITTLIYSEIKAGTFTFRNFYKRRAARLLPALAITLTIVLTFGFIFYNTKSFDNLGKEIFFSSFGAANILFAQGINYFANDAAYQPLLHLWSLGVEEQFYLIWPILLLISYRISDKLVLPLACLLLLASLYLSVLAVNAEQTKGYFLIQFRAFELLIGVVVALCPYSHVNFKLNELSRQLLSFLGLLLVLAPIVLLDHNSSFPGLNALYPCIGTALIIAFPNKGLITKLLSQKLLVTIGLISYPLYLFHQPILSFLHFFDNSLSPLQTFLLVTVTSVIFAWLTYRFIEAPIRKIAKAPKNKKSFLPMAALVSLFPIFALSGITIAKTGGLEERFKLLNPFALKISKAHSTTFHEHFKRGYRVSDSEKTKALFIGDSVLQHYVLPIKQTLNLEFDEIDTVTRGGCVLLKGVVFEDIFSDISCNQLREDLYTNQKTYDYIIISQAWSSYNSSVKNFPKDTNGYEKWAFFINATIEHFKNSKTKIILIGEHITVDGTLKLQPSILSNETGFKNQLKTITITNRTNLESSIDFFNKYNDKASVVHPLYIFCKSKCITSNGSWSYFSDAHHVSMAATGFITDRLKPLLK